MGSPKSVKIGTVTIGGGAPIAIQTMCSTKTADVAATLAQIKAQAKAGCHVTRVAIPNKEAALALSAITKESPLPIVADIHFDYRLALMSIDGGAAEVRINPGNIGAKERVAEVVKAAKAADIPIRIGVNSGSLPQNLRHLPLSEGLVQAALDEIKVLEDLDFSAIKISIKATDVLTTVKAYRKLHTLCDYPLHLGLTESGTLLNGAIRSSAALAILLSEGIGDTIRVSLASDPIKEVLVAKELLRSLDLYQGGVVVHACPTCARCHGSVWQMAEKLEERLATFKSKRTINLAVMGCEVNGPGEAALADMGMAMKGNKEAILFVKGEMVASGPEEEIFNKLIEKVENYYAEKM